MNKPVTSKPVVVQAGISAAPLGSSVADSDQLRWWQTAVVYEIAVISFNDSDGDGRGDLNGLDRIDYLEWLGVDAVWLTPIYASPMLDFGYDISDFCAVNPVFGAMADFDRLVDALHSRHIRLIMDF